MFAKNNAVEEEKHESKEHVFKFRKHVKSTPSNLHISQ
jgi:hypothetical protein